MLKILRWDDYPSDDLAVAAIGKPYCEYPDSNFDIRADFETIGDDPWFRRCLLEIDNATVACPGQALDLSNNRLHSFDKVSTGVKTLWLMYHLPDLYTYPSQWLGENCYQQLLDIGAEKDIIVFDDSDMLCRRYKDYRFDNCHGQFQDFLRGTIYDLIPGGRVAWKFSCLPGAVPSPEYD